MTKIITVFITIFITTIVHAQIKKGNILVGGSFYASTANQKSTSTNSEKQNAIGLNLSLGKAVKDNNVIGVNIGLSNQNLKKYFPLVDSSVNKNKGFNVGCFYQKYTKVYNALYFFVEPSLNANFGVIKNNSTFNNNSSYYNSINAGVAAGLACRVYKKLQMEINLPRLINIGYTNNYSNNSNSSYNRITTNQFSVNTSLNSTLFSNVGVGFNLVF